MDLGELQQIIDKLMEIKANIEDTWNLVGDIGNIVGVSLAKLYNFLLPLIGLDQIQDPMMSNGVTFAVLLLALYFIGKGGDLFLGFAKSSWNFLIRVLIGILIITSLPNIL